MPLEFLTMLGSGIVWFLHPMCLAPRRLTLSQRPTAGGGWEGKVGRETSSAARVGICPHSLWGLRNSELTSSEALVVFPQLLLAVQLDRPLSPSHSPRSPHGPCSVGGSGAEDKDEVRNER